MLFHIFVFNFDGLYYNKVILLLLVQSAGITCYNCYHQSGAITGFQWTMPTNLNDTPTCNASGKGLRPLPCNSFCVQQYAVITEDTQGKKRTISQFIGVVSIGRCEWNISMFDQFHTVSYPKNLFESISFYIYAVNFRAKRLYTGLRRSAHRDWSEAYKVLRRSRHNYCWETLQCHFLRLYHESMQSSLAANLTKHRFVRHFFKSNITVSIQLTFRYKVCRSM